MEDCVYTEYNTHDHSFKVLKVQWKANKINKQRVNLTAEVTMSRTCGVAQCVVIAEVRVGMFHENTCLWVDVGTVL